MKTIELFQGMQPQAKRKLEFVMKSHSRESLVNLYHFLCGLKAGTPGSKAQMFEKTFGEKYSASKDYLLRNELRLLGEEIKEVLATQLFLKSFRTNSNFNRLWTERVFMDLGKYAASNPVPDGLPSNDFAYDQAIHWADLLEQWLKKNIESGEMNAGRITEMIAGAENLVRLRQIEASRKLAQASVVLGASRRWALNRHGKENVKSAKKKFDLNVPREQDPIASFLFYQSLAQGENGKEKIRLLEISLEYLKKCGESALFDRQGMQMGLLAAIALEWFLLGDYEMAGLNYERALSLKPSKKHPVMMAIVVNYFSNLLKAGQYSLAISVTESYRELFVDSPQARFPFLALKGMCYLFLNEPSKALACIPADIHLRPGNTYILFRFVQAIVPALKKDNEDAEREAHNLLKMIRYWKNKDRKRMKELELDYLIIAGWFIRCFQSYSKPGSEGIAVRKKLLAEIRGCAESKNPLFRDFLPLKWLLGSLGNA